MTQDGEKIVSTKIVKKPSYLIVHFSKNTSPTNYYVTFTSSLDLINKDKRIQGTLVAMISHSGGQDYGHYYA